MFVFVQKMLIPILLCKHLIKRPTNIICEQRKFQYYNKHRNRSHNQFQLTIRSSYFTSTSGSLATSSLCSSHDHPSSLVGIFSDMWEWSLAADAVRSPTEVKLIWILNLFSSYFTSKPWSGLPDVLISYFSLIKEFFLTEKSAQQYIVGVVW